MLTILRTILRRLALPALLFPAIATGAPVAAADSVANSAHGTVLVFTRTLGWRHDSIPEAVRTLRELAQAEGLAVVHSEDPALFDDAGLARFRAVVFANTTGEVLGPTQRAAFERYMRTGGGFMGVHSAADTGYGWPWYGRLVGAWFANHPPGLQSTEVRFEHGLGPDGIERWQVTDELYNYRRNPRPEVTVVATVDESRYEGGRMGADHPIAWCHAGAGGRAWYTGLGHAVALYADPVFRAHLRDGLRYAAGLGAPCLAPATPGT
ncbi:Crp/Fnr family transcriptional regulator [Pseudoxanthomonas jiangsuensis]|uniref:ThuA domain-containing protein n=1 Tax=Pseudoxanthomonas jiangsuensis TaxID=619688 RepID=UPI0013911EDD|nr:ThuA domain-containing protein [Pseudoxanthomonas jiangsuensis]KAF1698225.1 Crp/Fnr family transcriptional regulator [Pseudoxanthomonas jiangsuensis]